MPEHSSWLTIILSWFQANLEGNLSIIGDTFIGGKAPEWTGFEPIFAMIFVALLVLGVSAVVRTRLADADAAVIPEETLTLRTFVEVFLGYFYDLAKSVMGPERAKKYYGVIGAAAMFVFFSNVLAMVPGMPIATSSLNVTMGCALVVFVLFNLYGLMANGVGYIKHLMGPVWYMAPIVLPIEVISLLVRPVTLAVRLMLNMTVDHLILGIMLGLFPLLLPIPVQFLGVIIIVVQTLVFTLLTAIYIGLATEHDEEHH
jgi:F-type H+-transporting ATPase subunit a